MISEERLREIVMRYVSQTSFTLTPLLRAVEAEARKECEAERDTLGAQEESMRMEREVLAYDNKRYLKAFVHYHVNNGVDEACKQCGLDLRDRIHSFTAVADLSAP